MEIIIKSAAREHTWIYLAAARSHPVVRSQIHYHARWVKIIIASIFRPNASASAFFQLLRPSTHILLSEANEMRVMVPIGRFHANNDKKRHNLNEKNTSTWLAYRAELITELTKNVPRIGMVRLSHIESISCVHPEKFLPFWHFFPII